MIGLFAVTIGQQRQRLLASLSMKLGKMDNIPITHQLLVKTDEEERESERQRTRAQPVLKRLLTTTEDNLKKNPLLRYYLLVNWPSSCIVGWGSVDAFSTCFQNLDGVQGSGCGLVTDGVWTHVAQIFQFPVPLTAN